MNKLSVILAVLCMSASGCYLSRSSKAIRARYASAFECNPDKVKVEPLKYWGGAGTLRASGCGKRAIYYCELVTFCVRDR